MLLGVEGRLTWRSYVDTKGEKKSGMAVFAMAVRVLAEAAALADSAREEEDCCDG